LSYKVPTRKALPSEPNVGKKPMRTVDFAFALG